MFGTLLAKHTAMHKLPLRTEDAPDAGGGSAPNVPATETTETVVETTATSVDDDEDDFVLSELDNKVEPASSQGANNGGTNNFTDSAEKVPKSDYDKVVAELNEAKGALANFQKLNEEPVFKKTLEYLVGLEEGVEADPQILHEKLFGINVNNLTEEALVTKIIQLEAVEEGLSLTQEEMEYSIRSRMSELDSIDDKLKRSKEIRIMREKVGSKNSTDLKHQIEGKVKDKQKANDFWNEAGNQLETALNEMVVKGRKDFGLKTEITKTDVDNMLNKVTNGVYRFLPNGSLDIPHLIEVLQFATDPKAYYTKVKSKVKGAAQVQNLATQSAGNTIKPGDVASVNQPKTNGFRDLSKEKMEDFDPRKATRIN